MIQNQLGDLGSSRRGLTTPQLGQPGTQACPRVWLPMCKSLTHQGHGVLLLHVCFSAIFSLGSLTFEMFREYFTEVTAWENCHAAKEENP